MKQEQQEHSAQFECYARSGLVLSHGKGCRLFDKSGRSWLDFLSGIGVNALGHAHPRLTEALSRQLRTLMHCSNVYEHELQEAFASGLAQACGLDRVFLSNSGTEAMECALKLARRFHFDRGETEKTGFLALEGAFHGRSLGSLSCTWKENFRTPFAPLLAGVDFVSPQDIASLERLLGSGRYAALVMEPIQGESGVLPLSVLFLQEARRITKETGTLLLFDEIQSGGGRTGVFLASQHAQVVPDICALAKPIGAGFPIGATLSREELADSLRPGDHGSTFGGGPLACRAGLVFLEELFENGLLPHVQEIGAFLSEALDSLVERHDVVLERRGVGLMQALVLDCEARPVNSALQDKGLLANATAGNVLRFLPPYIIGKDEVALAIDILDSVLALAPNTETNTES